MKTINLGIEKLPGAYLHARQLGSSPARQYATQTGLGATASGPRRQHVTPFKDDGRVPWAQLSGGEKVARATQQSFNMGLVTVGLVLTGAVTYFLWTDVFSPDSKISHFNQAVDKIKKDARCLELLGDANKITAHGDETFNKWRRARPVASTTSVDGQGNQHLLMHFYLEGPVRNGTAWLHLVKRHGEGDFAYKYFYVDIAGQERIYLEKEDPAVDTTKKPLKLFGVKWT